MQYALIYPSISILTHTITNERLARRGYYDISEAYKSLHLI